MSVRTLAAAVLVMLALLAALVPVLGIETAAMRLVGDGAQAPSWAHLLGTNRIGQDVLLRLWAALATAFSVGGLAVLFSAALALPVGILAAGPLGAGVARIADGLMAVVDGLPGYLLLACVALALAPSPIAPAAAVAAVLWSESARVLRARAREVLSRDWYAATAALGLTRGRRIMFHLMPALVPLLRTQAVLQFALAVKIEAALSVLGLLSSDRISLGQLLAESGAELALGRTTGFVAVSVLLAMLVLSLLGLLRTREDASINPY